MTLNVLICCFDSSIRNVAGILRDRRPDVRYIVSHQMSESYDFSADMEAEEVLALLAREDVVYSSIYGTGLSRNRNNSIETCIRTASPEDICLVADDDVQYTDSSFDIVLDAFRTSAWDIVTFQISTPDGAVPFKKYDAQEHEIKKAVIRGDGYVSSIEMAFRLAPVAANSIRFDENFGLKGKKYPDGGEEAVFISDCLKSGLKACYVPKVIVLHPFESSGKAPKTVSKARMMLGVARRTHGLFSFETGQALARLAYRKLTIR